MGPEELQRQAALEDRHFWYAARRRQVARLLPRAPRAGATALDLGAGSGGNTRLLIEAGFAAVALEHHPLAAAAAHARGLKVLCGDAHQLPFPDATFDVVLACDVFEHLTDDHRAVREVSRVLRPGGQVVVTVPADPSLWSPHDVALEHRRRYTRATLNAVLADNGLTVQSMASWMVLLRPLVALRRRRTTTAAPETLEGSPASDLDEVSRATNAALGAVLRLEHHLPWLGRRRGVSLIAVAANPGT